MGNLQPVAQSLGDGRGSIDETQIMKSLAIFFVGLSLIIASVMAGPLVADWLSGQRRQANSRARAVDLAQAEASGSRAPASFNDQMYLEYAKQIRRSGGGHIIDPRTCAIGAIGGLSGSFMVVQVVDETSALLDPLETSGLPDDPGLLVTNVGMTRTVDGDAISFEGVAFTYAGPQQYVTVLGARRTVHRFDALDSTRLERAFAYLDSEHAADARAQRAFKEQKAVEAMAEVARLEASLAEFEAENGSIEEYLHLVSEIKMYEPLAERSDIAQLLESRQAELKRLGTPDIDVLRAYQAEVSDRRDELERARKRLREANKRVR